MALSLQARALQFLAAREHSRLELARKLARHCDDPAEIESLLDTLSTRGLLSAERFVESVLHRRAARLGAARIKQELNQHGIDKALVSSALASLAGSEVQRAREVWTKRFGVAPAHAAERAKQMRFLQARGFSAQAIRAVLSTRNADADADAEPEAGDD